MKNIILVVCFLLLFLQNILSQDKVKLYDQLDLSVNKQIRWFLDTIHSEGEITKYFIFVLNCYKFDTVKNNYCYSISYIMNRHEYNLVNVRYYLKVDTNYIIARFCEDFDTRTFKINPIVVIDSNIEGIVTKKLYPSGYISGITGTSEAIMYCKENHNFTLVYYDNSDKLPSEAAIIQVKAPVEIRRYIRKE